MALLFGNRLDDLIPGDAGEDTLAGLGGNDTLDGGASPYWYIDKDLVDTAWYSGALSGYRFSADALGRLVVTDINATDGSDGIDTLSRIERLTFGNAALALGPAQVRVNTTTAGTQYAPSVASLADGGYVIAWAGPAANGSTLGDAFIQRFDRSGIPVGPETRVIGSGIANIIWTDVAAFGNGRTVVAYQGALQDSDPAYFVGLRLYGPTGAPASEVFLGAATSGSEDAESPAVAPLGRDGFLLAFHFRSAPDTANWTVKVARYEGGNDFATDVLEVSSPASGLNNSPDAAGVAGVGTIVVWSGPDAEGTGIFAQRFDGNGALAGSRFAVNTVTAGSQGSPSVAMLADGRFMVAWMSDNTSGFSDIVARIYNADGTPAGAQFLVDGESPFAQQVNPSVAAMDDGTFVVAWTDFSALESDPEVLARRFDADGDPVGEAFRVNGASANAQTAPRIAGLADGGFVAAWQDGANTASGTDISATLMDTLSGVRPPFIAGGAAADVINLGGTFTLMVDGGAGNDSVNGSSAIDFLQGGSGNDTLNGAEGGDHLMGGAGVDVLGGDAGGDLLDGGEGADRMTGGPGDDEYVVDNTGDVVTEAAAGGNDTVLSAVTLSLALLPNVENLVLTGTAAINATGNAAGNLLVGNDGNNRLDGGAGADLMSGGGGNDSYFVDNELDSVGETPATGIDTVFSSVSFRLPAYVEFLTLTGPGNLTGMGNAVANGIAGNAGANILVGEEGDDTITGGGGNDTLDGSQGDDILNGGAGNDLLSGRNGNDWFIFDTPLSAALNLDTLDDFNPSEDQIHLSKSVFSALGVTSQPLQAGEFSSGAGINAASAPGHRIIYNTTTGDLYYDRDGSATAASPVKFAVINGSPDTLDNTDFLVTT